MQHENFHLNARGLSENGDGTVTVYFHWWCDDCESGWTDEAVYTTDKYYQIEFED